MKELFFGGLRARLFENCLAVAAVAFVVAAAVAVYAVAEGAEKGVHRLAHDLGNNMLVVPKGLDMADFHAYRFGKEGMPDSFPDRIRKSDLNRHISSIQAMLYGNTEAGGEPFVLLGGRDYSRGDSPRDWTAENSVFLGRGVAAKLGLEERAHLALGAFRLAVAGVLDRPPEGLDMGAFLSLGTAQFVMGRPKEVNALRLAGCWCSMDVAALGAEVERLLPGTRAISVASVIKAQKGAVAVARRYKTVIPAAAALIVAAIVALMASGQVRRRTREIGLLLAMGARPVIVVGNIVAHSSLVGFLGGVSGWWIGVFLSLPYAGHVGMGGAAGGGNPFFRCLFVSMGVAVIAAAAALEAAFRAASMDPAFALREK